MITFSIALVLLVLGYLVYGALVEKVFHVKSENAMPCDTKRDNVDYMPLPVWRIFLIQFLNIAGTGPIFGAIMGILYGPAAYLWIVLGCIFCGATHDFMSGMISIRKGGASLPEIIGDELGATIRHFARIVTLILMVLVGAVFVSSPAGLIVHLVPDTWGFVDTTAFWCVVIFGYYILATVLPINTLIGRIYPLFGVALLIMALGIFVGIFTHEGQMPEISDAFTSMHPKGLSIIPMLFITIACGAISGFHATQSPMMARCMPNEKWGRPIFYGAMITEGVVALIWAAAAVKFASVLPGEGTMYEKLQNLLGTPSNPALVVDAICFEWMGAIGAVLAILGVVAAPITSGDTALRSARLILADIFKDSQKTIGRRLLFSLPVFAVAVILLNVNFDILWRYFAWINQSLSVFTLWACTVYLWRKGRFFYITLIPAMVMTFICSSYITIAPEGFGLPEVYGYAVGICFAALALITFAFGMLGLKRQQNK